jgi:hypothetical protein
MVGAAIFATPYDAGLMLRLLAFAALAPLFTPMAIAQSQVTIVHNAVIHTVDVQLPRAEALAFEGGVILSVGGAEEILAAYPDAEVISTFVSVAEGARASQLSASEPRSKRLSLCFFPTSSSSATASASSAWKSAIDKRCTVICAISGMMPMHSGAAGKPSRASKAGGSATSAPERPTTVGSMRSARPIRPVASPRLRQGSSTTRPQAAPAVMVSS